MVLQAMRFVAGGTLLSCRSSLTPRASVRKSGATGVRAVRVRFSLNIPVIIDKLERCLQDESKSIN